MAKDKVYSVTLEIKLTVRATSRAEAMVRAIDIARSTGDHLDTLRVTDVFCPAEGR